MTFIKETYYNVEVENLYTTKTTIIPVADSGLTITSSYIVLEPTGAITLSTETSIYDGFQDGQSVTLMIDDGSARTITWPAMDWVGDGSPPTLETTGYNVIVVWQVASTVYGSHIGTAI